MASVFTYDPDPPRVSSPWSTSGSSTPQVVASNKGLAIRTRSSTTLDPDSLSDYGITKLEPEPQEGPTEYKLHLLLRQRRPYTSMTTGHVVGGSYHSKANLSTSNPVPPGSSCDANSKQVQPKSIQGRQQRLQQLTTQLLWRLQQSSPFHSSTTANLVLPVLPETTPEPGASAKPSRLLPGLEESQGALYEIGVADDGTFVGLTRDEMEESLATLQVMAASLGCKVEVLRRVVVGRCEWEDEDPVDGPESVKMHLESLWVAEALVSPDLEFYRVSAFSRDASEGPAPTRDTKQNAAAEDDHSSTEQIRISITGPSTAGKSSLLGTLTSSVLDNGRGTSRLSLLKHRHEISSGITSSVAQELIGYAANSPSAETVDVINYASGNVAAWDDIHAASNGGRLAFVSDLPGSVRYLKSTLRGLISWAPHYVLLCIPANCDDGTAPEAANPPVEQVTDIALSLSYLELCIKLGIPTVVLITKMDLASRAGLRNTLTKVLSALKLAGKKPVMLPTGKSVELQRIDSTDSKEVKKIIAGAGADLLSTVPIVLTSAVDGSGIGRLHAFLRHLPIPERPPLRTIGSPGTSFQNSPTTVFDIDEVFAIPPSKVYSMSTHQTPEENQGVVLCGLVRYGTISVGDELVIGPLLTNPQPEQGSVQSFRSRPPSGEFSTSFVQGLVSGKVSSPAQAQWQRVRVASVRNLRLPVRKLTQDQVGTIGIEPLASAEDEQCPRLGRVRKGTILADFSPTSRSIPKALLFHTGFIATFPSSEFASSLSPPLLLGGNAIVYTSNIRTTVKVTCVTLAENEVISSPPSPTEPEFFSFDGDSPAQERDGDSRPDSVVNNVISSNGSPGQEGIKIAFSFVTSVDWVEVGSRVLLMPGAAMGATSVPGSGSVTGLEGFVGRVCDILHDDLGGK